MDRERHANNGCTVLHNARHGWTELNLLLLHDALILCSQVSFTLLYLLHGNRTLLFQLILQYWRRLLPWSCADRLLRYRLLDQSLLLSHLVLLLLQTCSHHTDTSLHSRCCTNTILHALTSVMLLAIWALVKTSAVMILAFQWTIDFDRFFEENLAIQIDLVQILLHNAMLACYILLSCVCVCECVSVTSLYCAKTAKLRIA